MWDVGVTGKWEGKCSEGHMGLACKRYRRRSRTVNSLYINFSNKTNSLVNIKYYLLRKHWKMQNFFCRIVNMGYFDPCSGYLNPLHLLFCENIGISTVLCFSWIFFAVLIVANNWHSMVEMTLAPAHVRSWKRQTLVIIDIKTNETKNSKTHRASQNLGSWIYTVDLNIAYS